jgi:hypothetical protein
MGFELVGRWLIGAVVILLTGTCYAVLERGGFDGYVAKHRRAFSLAIIPLASSFVVYALPAYLLTIKCEVAR